MVEVTTVEVFLPAGQLVTVGAHEVMVYSMVTSTVEVERGAAVVAGAEETAAEVDTAAGAEEVSTPAAVEVGTSVSVTGQMVVYRLTISVVT